MAWLSPSIFIGKTLEGRRLRRRADPRPDPCYGQGLEEGWTHKETEHAVVERQTPEGSDHIERNGRSQDTPWATKEGQGPQSPPVQNSL